MSRYRLTVTVCVALIVAGLVPLEAGAGTLAAVKERGWLRVCAHPDALPFSSQDRAQPGFQLEIADAIAKILGVKVIPEWIIYTRHARRADCDAVIGAVVPLTDEKVSSPRGALLTKAYAGSGYVLLVPQADTVVHRPEDVKAGKIGVEYTSWPHYQLQTHGIGITAYRDQTEIIEAVAKGEVAAGMVTDPYLGWFLKDHPQAGVKVADGYVRDPELQWNVAVRLVGADPPMRDAVNEALDRLLGDRTIQNILVKYGLTYVPPFNR
ncbi:MAG TPA: transporter substrate-binding domain-containing protein [Methylomirabilota bacterium]|nr:transporter substrate-binding domain-containing protein [Methylomirabilota bacterium]